MESVETVWAASASGINRGRKKRILNEFTQVGFGIGDKDTIIIRKLNGSMWFLSHSFKLNTFVSMFNKSIDWNNE